MKRILIADDEEATRFVIKYALEDAGFEVITAEDGYEAINLIREEMPDLVILDVNMPEISGLDVTKLMRKDKATEKIPVFISTAADSIKNEFSGLNIESFISKPYDVDILLSSVRRAIEKQ